VRTVAIAGTGLIGGSFGLALRAAGFDGEIIGVSSAPALDAALRVGAIDRGAPLAEAAAEADLIFLAQPVRRIIETIAQLDPLVKPGALITDAGSTKSAILEAAKRHIRRARFIGGHPMAGSERTGAEASDANLFRARPWALMQGETDAGELTEWIKRFGADVIFLDAAEHDRMVAFTSHLPQLASTALAAVQSNDAMLFGPGLLDMTRLALSSWELWGDIVVTNREAILDALDRYTAELTRLREGIRLADEIPLKSLFQQAQQLASAIRAAPYRSYIK